MYNSLIVMTIESEEEAPRIYETLQHMRSNPLPDLANVAAVTKDSEGRLAVVQKRELLPAGKVAGDRLLISAISFLFSEPPDETLQALAQDGFDNLFRQRVRETMGNSCSALLILVKRDTQVDRGRLFGILTLFNGQIFETTLPPKTEAVLAEGWED